MSAQGEAGEKRKLKILFLTKWYPNKFDPQLGVFIQKHARAVSQYCDTALLYITQDKTLKVPFSLVEKKQGSLHEFILYFKPFRSGIPPVDRFFNLLYYFLFMHAGKNMVSKKWGKQDLTHAYILIRPALAALLFKWRFKIPYIVSEQWSGFANGQYLKQSRWKRKLTNKAASNAEAMVVVSFFLKQKMIQCEIPGNYHIIPNTITPVLNSVNNTPPSSLVRILIVADLVDEIKNVSGVINCFAELSGKYSNINLHIIGDGKDRKKLEKLAAEKGLLAEKIFFLGRMTNEKVYEHLQLCSFLVVNSNVETFSAICIEAMSCGKPVIATRCGGPEDIVTEQTGQLIEPRNNSMLTDALQTMISGHKNYDSQFLIDYAHKNFGAEKIGRMYLDVYEKILDNNHS